MDVSAQEVKRNVLLNPGPATTTDSVKYAQIVPDICPREEEFGIVMTEICENLVQIAHGKAGRDVAVLFCGSGTLNIDVCLSSLLPKGAKVLIVNNGAYSSRAVEVACAYGLEYTELAYPFDSLPDLIELEKALSEDPSISMVYTTHMETGTGILNPIREIGRIAHSYGKMFVCDTTSTYAMIPIDLTEDNVDFIFASAQKGIMAMTGLSFVIGNEEMILSSKDYPVRSYYANLYMQHEYFARTGQMRFTPPVQTAYAARQAIREYWQEGEAAKYARHLRTFEALHAGLEALGFQDVIARENQAGLVISVKYPDDPSWDFEAVHDYCYARGFTIYPGKILSSDTFRLCSLGAIDEEDAKAFFEVLKEALSEIGVGLPVFYK